MNGPSLRCTTLFFSFQHRDVGATASNGAECDLLLGATEQLCSLQLENCSLVTRIATIQQTEKAGQN
jgi:hypothetical protein